MLKRYQNGNFDAKLSVQERNYIDSVCMRACGGNIPGAVIEMFFETCQFEKFGCYFTYTDSNNGRLRGGYVIDEAHCMAGVLNDVMLKDLYAGKVIKIQMSNKIGTKLRNFLQQRRAGVR